MNLDWTIVWKHRDDLLQGVGMTVLLTVLTMAAAIPGGIVLALRRGEVVDGFFPQTAMVEH